jgi:glycosyltransferase involved in cell wall biosynthesis
LLRCCERLTGALAHLVICQSASLQRVVLRERLCPARKCITLGGGIGNGVDAEDRFNPARVNEQAVRALRARYGIPRESLVVGYVGRLARDKGLRELEQAWRRISALHPDAHLLILGEPDARAPPDAAIIESLHSHPAVHFAGRVPDPVPYYAALDVLALPTYREGLPNVALEAAAMRIPVVATRTTGCIDAVHDGVTGLLVPPRSAETLAGALDLYLRSPELRRQHGAAGRARMLASFRQLPLWAELEALYASLLRMRPARAAAASKRVFDVVAAGALLLITAPLIALVALLVRLTIGSPVIFQQVRAGAQGRPFTLHKFRTMNDARSADGTLLPPAERLTRVGRWLRSTSLDELPQLGTCCAVA